MMERIPIITSAIMNKPWEVKRFTRRLPKKKIGSSVRVAIVIASPIRDLLAPISAIYGLRKAATEEAPRPPRRAENKNICHFRFAKKYRIPPLLNEARPVESS